MKKNNYIRLFIFISLFFPTIAARAASLSFSEIMYDVPGTDTGREWLEVQNTSSSTFLLSKFSLVQGGSKHAVTSFQGDSIQPGEYAVISSAPDKFKVDWPLVAGTIAKASYSLKNTGDSLQLIDSAGTVLDDVSYAPGLADGNGLSLQKINGTWIAASPTPALVNVPPPPEEPEVSDDEESNGSSSADTTDSSTIPSSQPPTSNQPVSHSSTTIKPPPEPVKKVQSTIIAPIPSVILPGSAIQFIASSSNLYPEFVLTTRYSWNFGDGESFIGQKTYHSFDVPGMYDVRLKTESGPLSLTTKASILVAEPSFGLASYATGSRGFISLKNNSAYELNISGWRIENGTSSFGFADDSFIMPRSATGLSFRRLGFEISEDNFPELVSPDGFYRVPLLLPVFHPKAK